MKKDNKKMLMILGVVAVAGLAIWMMRKKNGGGQGLGAPADLGRLPGDDLSIDNTPEPEPYDYGFQIQIANARGDGKYRWFKIEDKDRRRADASLQIGTKGIINDEMPCTVNDFWIDSDGEKGAFRCEEIPVGAYDIPGGSRFEY